jgi:dihydroorotate dehydrogenase electron transfer subunit
MEVEAAEIASAAHPGQFVMVRTAWGHDPLLRRPFSIHQVNGRQIAFLFKMVGRGTEWLAHRRQGDFLDLLGPLGKGFSIHPRSYHLLLVAGGMGIAPLLFLAQRALDNSHSVTLLLGARTASLLYPEALLPPKVELVLVTEDGSAGKQGLGSDFMPDFSPKADQIFACGPVPMYQAMATQNQLGGKSIQVSLEARMGCGLGACYGCTIKTRGGLKQVCKDGPVFELEDIPWNEIGI